MWNKIQRIYVGTNQVRPPTWKPWANTIAYYKFDNNLNDSSGNNRNLTTYSWTFTYWTTVQWAKFVQMDTSTSSSNLAVPFNLSNYTVSWWISFSEIRWSTYQWIMVDLEWWDGYPRLHTYANKVYSFTWDTWIAWTVNTWYNLICVCDWLILKEYINGTFISSYTLTTDVSSGTLIIDGIADKSRTQYRISWKLSELILENKARTAQEISDYYNQTKANYWL